MAERQTQTGPDLRVLAFQPLSGGVTERRYYGRAKHHKTTSGCMACKKRRKKCDELKPCCSRCARSRNDCIYRKENSAVAVTEAKDVKKHHRLPDLLSYPLIEVCEPHGDPANHALLYHFQQIFKDFQLNSTVNETAILSLAVSHPCLLNAVMAVSASHMCYHTVGNESSRSAEQLHQGLAVTHFRQALCEPLDQQRADAIVLTCMFLSVLTFSVVQHAEPSNSWLFRDGSDRLGWFSLNLGLKPLLVATEAYQRDSILHRMYHAADDNQNTFFGDKRSLDRLPAHWMTFLGLDRNASMDHVFREPARLLAEISRLEPTSENFLLYLNFIGGLDLGNQFRDRLGENDIRAVWLLGYWMGLLCRYDCWWMRGRAEMEWRASCLWLDRRRAVSGVDENTWLMAMHDLRTAN